MATKKQLRALVSSYCKAHQMDFAATVARTTACGDAIMARSTLEKAATALVNAAQEPNPVFIKLAGNGLLMIANGQVSEHTMTEV